MGKVDDALPDDIQPPFVIEVERARARVTYATDGRPQPPSGSSLADPYDRLNPPPRFRLRNWIVPLISARAMAITLFLFMPLSCFGLTYSALGEFTGLNPASLIGYVLCLPNVLLFLIDPSIYTPISGNATAVFYTIQFFYIYFVCLLIGKLLKRWLGE